MNLRALKNGQKCQLSLGTELKIMTKRTKRKTGKNKKELKTTMKRYNK